jgi:hypothetical protein
MLRKILCAAGICLFCGATSRGSTITYNFNDGTSDGLVLTANGGFSASFTGGTANVSEAAGVGNGLLDLSTPYSISGDFTATVTGSRSAIGDSELGLVFGNSVAAPPTGISDVFFVGTTNIGANIFLHTQTNAEVSNSATSVLFEIQRTGDTITNYYDAGSGLVAVNSETDATLTASGQVFLLLQEEFGDTGAHAGSFDNLTISSNSVPEPASAALILVAGLPLLGRRRTGVVRA